MEVVEREKLEDCLAAWAGWWTAYGCPGYVGAVLPPLRLTEATGIRPGLVRRTFARLPF